MHIYNYTMYTNLYLYIIHMYNIYIYILTYFLHYCMTFCSVPHLVKQLRSDLDSEFALF